MKLHILTIAIAALALSGCDPNNTDEYNQIDRDDIAGYEQFIKDYPQSCHVADAKERIAVAKEKLEYESINRDNPEEYEAFISKYPNSPYMEDARIGLENAYIMRELNNIRSNDIKGYKAFMRKHPRYAGKAEEKINTYLTDTYGNKSLSNGRQPYSRWFGANKQYDQYTAHSRIKVNAPYDSDVITIVRYNNQNGKVAGHAYIKAGGQATIKVPNDMVYQVFFYYGNGWYPDKEMANGIRGGFVSDEDFSKDDNPQRLKDVEITYTLTRVTNGNFSTSESNANEIF